jgi:hypothetical protein
MVYESYRELAEAYDYGVLRRGRARQRQAPRSPAATRGITQRPSASTRPGGHPFEDRDRLAGFLRDRGGEHRSEALGFLSG